MRPRGPPGGAGAAAAEIVVDGGRGGGGDGSRPVARVGARGLGVDKLKLLRGQGGRRRRSPPL